jgi:hypothetical protein
MTSIETRTLRIDSAESDPIAKIRRGLELLLGLVLFVAEIRCVKTKRGTQRGYFDDPQKMAESAFRLSGKVPGVYFTLNQVNPALLARSANKIASFAENTTTDATFSTVAGFLWTLTQYAPLASLQPTRSTRLRWPKRKSVRQRLRSKVGRRPSSEIQATARICCTASNCQTTNPASSW